jgi:hypothetical protein
LLNTIIGSFSTGVAPSTTSYESIATVTVGSGGSAANVEFTSIPATYTHLQIRGIARTASHGVDLQLDYNLIQIQVIIILGIIFYGEWFYCLVPMGSATQLLLYAYGGTTATAASAFGANVRYFRLCKY